MTEPTAPRASRREALREERLEVLRLLEGGSVTADEAAELLEALDRANRADPAARAADPTEELGFGLPTGGRGRVVRLRISEAGVERPVVNLAVPLGLIDSGLKVAQQYVPHLLPSAEAIREGAAAGFRGHILDVDSEGDRVEIVIE